MDISLMKMEAGKWEKEKAKDVVRKLWKEVFKKK